MYLGSSVYCTIGLDHTTELNANVPSSMHCTIHKQERRKELHFFFKPFLCLVNCDGCIRAVSKQRVCKHLKTFITTPNVKR